MIYCTKCPLPLQCKNIRDNGVSGPQLKTIFQGLFWRWFYLCPYSMVYICGPVDKIHVQVPEPKIIIYPDWSTVKNSFPWQEGEAGFFLPYHMEFFIVMPKHWHNIEAGFIQKQINRGVIRSIILLMTLQVIHYRVC